MIVRVAYEVLSFVLRGKRWLPIVLVMTLSASAQARSQAEPQNQAEPQTKDEPQTKEEPQTKHEPQTKEEPQAQPEPQIKWQLGPLKAKLGDLAEINVPEGYRFTDAEGARIFSELNQNPASGNELGILIPPIKEDAQENANDGDSWFILFTFAPIGYVKDDDKNSLDAKTREGILESLRQGTEKANEVRRQRGWTPLVIEGWDHEPFYDAQSHNLKWAVKCSSEGGASTNYNTRILCREGVLSANMVVDSKYLAACVPAYNSLISGVSFNSGKTYGAFRAGDKIAQYGLIGLITGVGGAAALKTGLFTKYLKPILLAIFAGVAAIWKGMKRIAGRLVGKPDEQPGTGSLPEQSANV